MTDTPRPPAAIEGYVEVLGPELAFAFLMRFGGAELYLSPTPKGRSEVEQMIGAERVAELAALGLPRRVPTAKPWLAAMMKTQGLSHAEIARRLHATDVTVRGWLQPRPANDPRQPSLF
jgi:hypothetical protein